MFCINSYTLLQTKLINILKRPTMFRSSFSSISPMSSKHGTVALLHSSPLHPSQAATHFKPLFRQEHRLVPQTFRDDNLHLHRMITKRFSGAASLSVITGNNRLLIFFHPQSSGFSTHLSNVFHTLTEKCICKLWK